MRNLVVLFALSILVQGVALAETGNKAKLTTTVEMGEEMLAMIGALAAMGSPDDAPQMEGMEPVVVNQTVYWSESGMRMDTLAEAGVDATIVFDYVNGVSYQFTSIEPVATKMAIDELAGGDGDVGMFGPDPMGMFMDWENYIAAMQGQQNMVINELAEKTVAGLPCKGISFSLDMEALMAESADSDTEGDLGMAMGMMGGMGGVGGEIWVNEGLGFPVLIKISAMGSIISMELGNVEEWTVDSAMFTVPEGYAIEEFEMPDFGDMELPEGT